MKSGGVRLTVVHGATNDSCTTTVCGCSFGWPADPKVLTDMKSPLPHETLWNIDPGPDCPDAAPRVLTAIQHFFEIYKEVEGKTVEMPGIRIGRIFDRNSFLIYQNLSRLTT